MMRHRLLQRLSRCLTGIVAAALLAVVAVPHVHADGASHHESQTACRACKLQDAFSAKTPEAAPQLIPAAASFAAPEPARTVWAPAPVLTPASPRAPPAVS